ncbi:hypothetical protein QJS66_08035 [Kocuria rhizophila]|nr:hypothetical protein QJS66_08035 [Kocuria rhizophila]
MEQDRPGRRGGAERQNLHAQGASRGCAAERRHARQAEVPRRGRNTLIEDVPPPGHRLLSRMAVSRLGKDVVGASRASRSSSPPRTARHRPRARGRRVAHRRRAHGHPGRRRGGRIRPAGPGHRGRAGSAAGRVSRAASPRCARRRTAEGAWRRTGSRTSWPRERVPDGRQGDDAHAAASNG